MDLFKGTKTSFYINPYTTKQEKELLFLDPDEFEGDTIIDFALDILGVGKSVLSSMSLLDKKLLLLKFRSISVGDVVDINYTCVHCRRPQSGEISISNLVHPAKSTSEYVKDLGRMPLNEQDFQYNFLQNADDLPYLEAEKLYKDVGDYQTLVDFKKKVRCVFCGKESKISIEGTDFILSIMSETTLTSLYKCYHQLMYYGHWTKSDIDECIPFERTLFLGMLVETMQKNADKINKRQSLIR